MSFDPHVPVKLSDLLKLRDGFLRAHTFEQRRIEGLRMLGGRAASRPSYTDELTLLNQLVGDPSEEKTPLPFTAADTIPSLPAVRPEGPPKGPCDG